MTTWTPTHSIPEEGLPARSAPDASLEPLQRIRHGVEVAVVEHKGGWARIQTDTGWEAWVDGTRLVAMAAPAAAAVPPPPDPAPESEPQPEPAPASAPSGGTWEATHTVPDGGLPAREKPDPGLEPLLRIQSGTGVRVLGAEGAWARIDIESGWAAWVDQRRLIPLGGTVAAAAAPSAADPAPAPAPEPEVWKATHAIPEGGLSAWSEPKADRQPILKVKSGTEVQVIKRAGAWALVRTEPGWEAWMDGRRLLEIT